jgi:hypothetical protein
MKSLLAGLLAGISLVSGAQAASLTVTDAKVEGGRLVVKGTSSPHQSVSADGRFTVVSNAAGAFGFSISNYMPPDCVIDVTAGRAKDSGVIANCGPAGVTARGAWTTYGKYLQNDLVTFQGSTWRAKLFNAGKQPNSNPRLWELFAARGEKGLQGAVALSTAAQSSNFVESGAGPAGEFALTYGDFTFPDGPNGSYNDHVWAYGYNVGNPGVRSDPSQPSLELRFESKYYQSNTFGSEFHLANITTNGRENRPLSFFLPHDGGPGSLGYMQADRLVFATLGGLTSVQMNTAERAVYLMDGTVVRGNVNNAPILSQRNASGGSFVELLKLNNGDVVQASGPFWVVGPRAGANAVYPGEFAAFQPTAGNSGDTGISLKGPAVTGTYNAAYLRADATAGTTSALVNYSQSPTANATEFLQVHVGSGDPQTTFDIAGKAQARWTVGVDNSDGAKFKIARSGALGSNDMIVVDNNSTSFASPPKVPSYTLATAPSASLAGAGAMILITDDAGGPVLAYSDGTNWRRFNDKSIITTGGGGPQSRL